MKTLFCILTLSLLLPVSVYIKRKTTFGFKPQKIFSREFTTQDNEGMAEIDEILNQTFYFLDRGTQSYVFESEDRKYVLKWLRYDRISPSIFHRFLTLFLPEHNHFKKKVERFGRKIQLYENACTLAYEHLKEETALLYIHPHITRNLQKKVQIVDRLGRRFDVDLKQTRFVLQRRVQSIDEALIQATDKETVLHSFVDVLEKRLHSCIGNKDPNIFKNYGFHDGKVCEIDFADYFLKLGLQNPILFEEEKKKYIEPMRTWMEKYFPDQEWKEVLE